MPKWKKCKCKNCGKVFRSGRDAYKHEVWSGHKTEPIPVPKEKIIASTKLTEFSSNGV